MIKWKYESLSVLLAGGYVIILITELLYFKSKD